MTQKPPSRLIITRRIGESFLVADTYMVTLIRNRHGLALRIDAGSNTKTIPTDVDKPAHIMDNVIVELRVHREAATSTYRVMILAPREISVVRSELLTAQ